ncbi:MAG: hypothetical protein Q7T58_02290 [Methylotenera sp.]|nr:hypothetical protein [Methylotenera sp.]
MKIFEMNDCDWVVGESLEQIKLAYLKDYGENAEYAMELTDSELDTLIFTDCDENETPTGGKRTFREQLEIEVAAGGTFPRLFASTED